MKNLFLSVPGIVGMPRGRHEIGNLTFYLGVNPIDYISSENPLLNDRLRRDVYSATLVFVFIGSVNEVGLRELIGEMFSANWLSISIVSCECNRQAVLNFQESMCLPINWTECGGHSFLHKLLSQSGALVA